MMERITSMENFIQIDDVITSWPEVHDPKLPAYIPFTGSLRAAKTISVFDDIVVDPFAASGDKSDPRTWAIV
jgi:hypothetical protein